MPGKRWRPSPRVRRKIRAESIGFRAFRPALQAAFPLVDGAPEGIRTPNLLTYSAVSEGLTESTEMCLQQAFSAGRDIPIWVNPYESTDVCSGKVADSRFRRRAFRWRNSDGGRTCRNLVSEANSPVGPATGRQALTELIVHGESSALRTVPLMDVREWWRSGFPEFAANPRTRPLV